MNSLAWCMAMAMALVLVAGPARAGEAGAPIQKRGILGYAGGYGYAHYGQPLAHAHSPYAYTYHAPLATAALHYPKVVVPAVAKVAYPSYSYASYPLGYSKIAYTGYPLAYSKVAIGAYPAYSYSKVVSPYHYW